MTTRPYAPWLALAMSLFLASMALPVFVPTEMIQYPGWLVLIAGWTTIRAHLCLAWLANVAVVWCWIELLRGRRPMVPALTGVGLTVETLRYGLWLRKGAAEGADVFGLAAPLWLMAISLTAFATAAAMRSADQESGHWRWVVAAGLMIPLGLLAWLVWTA